jgi:hypothetical protein
MPPRTPIQLPYNEAHILLAVSAIDEKQIKNVYQTAITFVVLESTLRTQCAGTAARRDCEPELKKLTKLEEEDC